MSFYRRIQGTGLGAHLSSAHIANSRIAAAAGNSSSLQPSRSSLQVSPSVEETERSPICGNYWKLDLDMEGLLLRSLEELPVTSSYYSPDLEVNQKQNNLCQMIFKQHVLYLRKKKVLRKRKYMLDIMQFINVSMSQGRGKKSHPLFIFIHMGKSISDFRRQISPDSECTCNTAIFVFNILPFKKTLQINVFYIISQSSDFKKPIKDHCAVAILLVFLTK